MATLGKLAVGRSHGLIIALAAALLLPVAGQAAGEPWAGKITPLTKGTFPDIPPSRGSFASAGRISRQRGRRRPWKRRATNTSSTYPAAPPALPARSGRWMPLITRSSMWTRSGPPSLTRWRNTPSVRSPPAGNFAPTVSGGIGNRALASRRNGRRSRSSRSGTWWPACFSYAASALPMATRWSSISTPATRPFSPRSPCSSTRESPSMGGARCDQAGVQAPAHHSQGRQVRLGAAPQVQARRGLALRRQIPDAAASRGGYFYRLRVRRACQCEVPGW